MTASSTVRFQRAVQWVCLSHYGSCRVSLSLSLSLSLTHTLRGTSPLTLMVHSSLTRDAMSTAPTHTLNFLRKRYSWFHPPNLPVSPSLSLSEISNVCFIGWWPKGTSERAREREWGERERERDRDRDRDRDRQTDRQTDRDRQKQKETETETQRDTETQREGRVHARMRVNTFKFLFLYFI